MRPHNDWHPYCTGLNKILPPKGPKTPAHDGNTGLGVIPGQLAQRIPQHHLYLTTAFNAAAGAIANGQQLRTPDHRPRLLLQELIHLLKALGMPGDDIEQGALYRIQILLALLIDIPAQRTDELLFLTLTGTRYDNDSAPQTLGKTGTGINLPGRSMHIEFKVSGDPHCPCTNDLQTLVIPQALGIDGGKTAVGSPHQTTNSYRLPIR